MKKNTSPLQKEWFFIAFFAAIGAVVMPPLGQASLMSELSGISFGIAAMIGFYAFTWEKPSKSASGE
ncbi:MAG: hypothetical protein AB7U30_07955 [Sulfuricellaceae bacterium]|jgi:hypothetical protein